MMGKRVNFLWHKGNFIRKTSPDEGLIFQNTLLYVVSPDNTADCKRCGDIEFDCYSHLSYLNHSCCFDAQVNKAKLSPKKCRMQRRKMRDSMSLASEHIFYDFCMMLGGRTVLQYYPIQEKLVGIVQHFPAYSLWDELRNSCSCSFLCLTKGPGARNVPRDICVFTESTFRYSSNEGMLFDRKIQKMIALRLKPAWRDFF